MKIIILVLTICISITSLAICQDNKNSNDIEAETIIEYARFMREEAQAHREYLEKLYTTGGTIAGIIVTIFAGIITWINWKTKEEFKSQINAYLKSYSELFIEESINKFKNQTSVLYDKFENDISHRNIEIEKKVHNFENDLNLLKIQLQNNITSMVDIFDKKHIKVGDQSYHEKFKEKHKILWVDDNPENNLVPRRIFENVGIQIKLAKSTEDAIKELNISDYKLIISDMGRNNNPEAGLDLLEKLKFFEIKIPIIIYSSIPSIKKYGQQASELGALSSINGVSLLTSQVYEILGLDPINPN